MNSNIFDKTKVLNLYKEKNYQGVTKLGSKLLQQNSNDYQLTYFVGLSFIHLQNYNKAEKYFDKLLLIKKNAEIYFLHANIKKQLKKFDVAINSFEEAIKLNPDFSEAYNNLGNTKKLIDKPDEAVECFKKAISLKKNNIQAYFNLANIYDERKNFKDLIEIYENILSFNKKHLKTLYNLGSAHLFLGNIEKGKDFFEKIIEIDNQHIPSFRNYISVTKIDDNNKIFQKLENIDSSNFTNENKILIYDALSKGYFDKENNDLAFNYLEKSNLLKKENSKFSFENVESQFSEIKFFFEKIDYINLDYKIKYKTKPIFIIGMPRSGTSLIEQILSSHSKIYGAGELDFLPKIIDKLGIKQPKNLEKYFIDIRNFYFDQITRISNNYYIIDKLPVNFRWIGIILNAFPEAKIIHIERNPMAVCWSNYKTSFVDYGMDFNLTQKDIAKYYSLYSDIMRFWNEKYKEQIFNINYENFVQDFEKKTKEILNYIDLKWEDEIKNYNRNKRPVRTASFQQVREEIKKDTSLKWKKYTNYLTPMQETLKSLKIDF